MNKISKGFNIKLQNFLLNRNFVILNYTKADKEIFNLCKNYAGQMKASEFYTLYTTLKEVLHKKEGNIAEVGVYQGNSAEIICKTKGNQPFYAIDTFEGLPDPSNKDVSGEFNKGDFWNTNYEKVSERLKKYPNVYVHRGIFPQSKPEGFDELKFIFVHLDVDLYESTFQSLEFFYDKMLSGGIIISHDYVDHLGVKRAFDDFFKDKKESVIELPGTQCLVMKI